MLKPMPWTRCLALVACTACTALQAAPVTVTAGQTASFNFSLPAANADPQGPYARIEVSTGLPFDPLAPPRAGHWLAFSELNGVGTELNLTAQGLGVFPLSFSGDGFADGIFSVRLEMTQGTVTIDPFAVGRTVGESTSPIGPLQAPEPASLALTGAALLALFAAQRARRPLA